MHTYRGMLKYPAVHLASNPDWALNMDAISRKVQSWLRSFDVWTEMLHMFYQWPVTFLCCGLLGQQQFWYEHKKTGQAGFKKLGLDSQLLLRDA